MFQIAGGLQENTQIFRRYFVFLHQRLGIYKHEHEIIMEKNEPSRQRIIPF